MRWSAHYPIFNRKEDAYRYAFSQHSTRARKLQSYELSSRPFCSYERDSRPDSTLLRRPPNQPNHVGPDSSPTAGAGTYASALLGTLL